MAQISKGDTFIDGQQVTGARLNQLVDSSVLLVGAVSEQTPITANSASATDTILLANGNLRKATVGDILNSNLPVTASAVTTSAIIGGAGVDITVAPAAGKKFDVNGAFEANSINVIGDATIGGNETITGNLAVTGTISGNINTTGSITSSGTVNLTGVLQVNGTVGYVLYEVLEESASYWNATTPTNYSGVFTSSTFTKPSDEIWEFEISYNVYGDTGYGMGVGVRYNSQTAYTGTYKFLEYYTVSTHSYSLYHRTHSWKEGVGVTLTAESVKVDACAGASSAMAMFLTSTSTTVFGVFAGFTTPITPSKFRIYKYKTA